MYAILRAGGKQLKVSPGDVVRIETPSDKVSKGDVLATLRDQDLRALAAQIGDGKLSFASGSSITLSERRNSDVFGNLEKYKDKLVAKFTNSLMIGGKIKSPFGRTECSDKNENNMNAGPGHPSGGGGGRSKRRRGRRPSARPSDGPA